MGLALRTVLNTRRRAFTLVEMAMVLVVVGIVMMIVFPALLTIRSSQQRALTEANLQALMRATATYVQANGCLPCPSLTGKMAGFGRVRGDTNAAACGICAKDSDGRAQGIAPFVSLGIPETMAKDGWGHWITMRVESALTVSFTAKGVPVIPPFQTCTVSDVTDGICTKANSSEKGLCKAALASSFSVQPPGTAAEPGVSQPAAVLFIAHGPQGYGALIPQPFGSWTSFPFPSLAAATYTNTATAFVPGVAFDGMYQFMDRNNLVSYFGNGACNTRWP